MSLSAPEPRSSGSGHLSPVSCLCFARCPWPVRRLQVECARGPRQRGIQLQELHLPHARRVRNSRQPRRGRRSNRRLRQRGQQLAARQLLAVDRPQLGGWVARRRYPRRRLPGQTWFQSMRIVRSSLKQRLSLRMSRCRTSVPASEVERAASGSIEIQLRSHCAETRPRLRKGPGSRATSSQPVFKWEWNISLSISARVGICASGARATSGSTRRTASIHSLDQGGGQKASLRSSSNRTGISSWSSHAMSRGSQGASTCE
jgi:hypothetical protein